MASQTLTFIAAKDTYVNSKYPDNNYGSSALRAGIYGLTGSHTEAIAFIGFDLSSIPKSRVITSIKLEIYISDFVTIDGPLPDFPPELWEQSPVVIRTRRVNGYTLGEIETSLNYSGVTQKAGDNNIVSVRSASLDTTNNVSYALNGYYDININDISRSENGEYIFAIFRDWGFISAYHCMIDVPSREDYFLKPKLIVTTDDYVAPKPTELVPNNSVRNKAGEINLTWKFEDLYMGSTQSGFELSYSTNGFTTQTTVTGGTANKYVIPANIFTVGNTVQWKVRITDSLGNVSAWSDVASFTIGATVPSIPEISSPINTIVNSADEVYFRWKFKDLYGYSQAKFDLQYKRGIETETTATITSQSNIYVMPKNTLSGGDYTWRIRTYNPFGEASPYSEWYSFYSIGKPETPQVQSVSNSCQPVIKWTAVEQDLFVIKIYKPGVVIYDSGQQVGRDLSEYEIPEYLDNGNYTLGIKVSNRYGFWSNETAYSFAINTTKPDKPTMAYSVSGLSVSMLINSASSLNIIYRKGEKEEEFKLVATIAGNNFIDYSIPTGSNQYFVRAVSGDGYNDSDIYYIDIDFVGIVIADKDNLQEYINLYKTKDSDRRKSISTAREKYLIKCAGRKYPIQQITEFYNHSENHEYFIHQDEFDKFYQIINSDTLLYRNGYGYSFLASSSVPSIQEDTFGYIVSFTLTRLEE